MPASALFCLLIAHPGCVVLVVLGLVAVRTTAAVWPALRAPTVATAHTPDPDANQVRRAAENVNGVAAVDDLQVWTLPSGVHGFTGVVKLAPGAAWQDVLPDVHAAARVALEDPIPHATSEPLVTPWIEEPRPR